MLPQGRSIVSTDVQRTGNKQKKKIEHKSNEYDLQRYF